MRLTRLFPEWDEEIVQVICAFANDYEGADGGDVFAGAKQANGKASVVGLSSEDLENICRN